MLGGKVFGKKVLPPFFLSENTDGLERYACRINVFVYTKNGCLQWGCLHRVYTDGLRIICLTKKMNVYGNKF